MKKFFGLGLLALLTTAYFTSSCSRDEFSGSLLEAKKATFNDNFIAEYGNIAPKVIFISEWVIFILLYSIKCLNLVPKLLFWPQNYKII